MQVLYPFVLIEYAFPMYFIFCHWQHIHPDKILTARSNMLQGQTLSYLHMKYQEKHRLVTDIKWQCPHTWNFDIIKFIFNTVQYTKNNQLKCGMYYNIWCKFIHSTALKVRPWSNFCTLTTQKSPLLWHITN